MVTAEVGHPDHRDMLVHLVKGWLADLEIQAETSTASLLLLPVLASRRGVGDIPVVPGAAGRVAGGGGGGAPQPRAPTMQVGVFGFAGPLVARLRHCALFREQVQQDCSGPGQANVCCPVVTTPQVVQDVVCARLRSACAESLLWGCVLAPRSPCPSTPALPTACPR